MKQRLASPPRLPPPSPPPPRLACPARVPQIPPIWGDVELNNLFWAERAKFADLRTVVEQRAAAKGHATASDIRISPGRVPGQYSKGQYDAKGRLAWGSDRWVSGKSKAVMDVKGKGKDSKGKDKGYFKGKDDKGKGKDAKGKDRKEDDKGKGKDAKCKDGKDDDGKGNKGKDAQGKDGKDVDAKGNKGKDGAGKDGAGKDGKGDQGKDATVKDDAGTAGEGGKGDTGNDGQDEADVGMGDDKVKE